MTEAPTLAAKHEAHPWPPDDDLLHAKRGEIRELKFQNGPDPAQAAPTAIPPHPVRKRRVHARGPTEALHEIAGDLKGSAIDTDILPMRKPFIGFQAVASAPEWLAHRSVRVKGAFMLNSASVDITP